LFFTRALSNRRYTHGTIAYTIRSCGKLRELLSRKRSPWRFRSTASPVACAASPAP
jgi:hypothetical protein